MKQFNWIVFFGFLFLVSCGNNEEAVSPEKRKITETVYASGILVPENEYILRAQTEGSVSRIFYAEGDSILAGKTLLEISASNVFTPVGLNQISSIGVAVALLAI